MNLQIQKEGFIEQFDFKYDKQLNHNWIFTPSDNSRFSFNERDGFLRLKHGSRDFYLLRDINGFDFLVMDIVNDYNPTKEGDTGGIIIYKNNYEYIELTEFWDGASTVSYPYLRVVKKLDNYEGYGSNDGVIWEFIGSGKLEGVTKIGIFLRGLDDEEYKDYDIKSIKLYEDVFISVTNLREKYKVDIYNSLNQLILSSRVQHGYSGVHLNMYNNIFPIKGYFKIYDENNRLISTSENIELWGGDIFNYTFGLVLQKDNLDIESMIPYDLGTLTNQGIIEKFQIKNIGELSVNNIKVSILQYLNSRGYKFAEISLDNYGIPIGFSKEILIPTINPNESINIWVKIERTNENSYYEIIAKNQFLLYIDF